MGVNDGDTSERDATGVGRFGTVACLPCDDREPAIRTAYKESGTLRFVSSDRCECVQPCVVLDRVGVTKLSACVGRDREKKNDCEHAPKVALGQRNKLWRTSENLRRRIHSCG